MAKYFKPDPTKNNRNYHVLRKNRAGKLVHDQICPEGVYTEKEMASIVCVDNREYGVIPGKWIRVKTGGTAYIFGLRQLICDDWKEI